jgi:hypothetical protein
MIPGSSGSDSRALKCDDGRRATVLAFNVLPRSGADGADGSPAVARTVVVSSVRAMSSVMWAASARLTRVSSKPWSDATTMLPGSSGSMTKVPSASDVSVLTTVAPSST